MDRQHLGLMVLSKVRPAEVGKGSTAVSTVGDGAGDRVEGSEECLPGNV